MKCSYCDKEIEGYGIVISCDGDFVCNEECKKGFHEEMGRIGNMSDKEFENWMFSK